ncbi:MAG: carbohydrate deacetylase [Candidatus Acidiferrales bacterium]
MKRLIINADDFGLTRGVNRGILEAARNGILTSTTLMANGPEFLEAVGGALQNPALGVGVHLVLVGGMSVAPARSVRPLASRDGLLPKSLAALVVKLSTGLIGRAQIVDEFRAQIERVRAAGIRPTHLDTHKHTHCHPRVMEALGQVASEFEIRAVRNPFELRPVIPSGAGKNGRAPLAQEAAALAARAGERKFHRVVARRDLRAPDYFFGLRMTGQMGVEAVRLVLASLPEGTSELMCHPGYNDDALRATGTRLAAEREVELAALLDPSVRRAVQENGIALATYREFNDSHA